MKKSISLLLITVLVTGCVSIANKPIDSKNLTLLNNKTIVYTQRSKTDFAAMTAGKAAFALIGALAMISAGNKIVADNHIEDPQLAMGESISKALAGKISNASNNTYN